MKKTTSKILFFVLVFVFMISCSGVEELFGPAATQTAEAVSVYGQKPSIKLAWDLNLTVTQNPDDVVRKAKTRTSLNLRTCRNETCASVTIIPADTQVQVSACKIQYGDFSAWCKVSYGNKTGFANADFLTNK